VHITGTVKTCLFPIPPATATAAANVIKKYITNDVFNYILGRVLIMLLPLDFAVLLIITVTSTMDTYDIIIAVRNIRLYDCDAGNEPTIPFMVV
jgi:hypothetical protein